LKSIFKITRSNDWRYSFIPQIFGTLYLWIYIFQISFSIITIKLLFLSLTTSFGFAALGYIINEFFDQKDDFIAGKRNKLKTLSSQKLVLLIFGILIAAFLPWISLPTKSFTIWLIGIQICLFILYAVPPFRLKNNFIFAPIIDSLYAYVLPLILSCYTFYLYNLQTEQPIFFLLVMTFLFFIAGYRNIILHFITDFYTDQKLGKKTLPQIRGIRSSLHFLIKLVYIEYCLIFFLLLLLFIFSNKNYLFKVSIPLVLLIQYFSYNKKSSISVREFIKLPNTLYQFYFPFICLLNLMFIDQLWVIWFPFHLILLVPYFRFQPLINLWNRIHFKHYYYYIYHHYIQHIRMVLSWLLNYSIYFLFLLFRIDLKKKNISAITYIKKKIKKH
jgi:hypothetical protein